MKLINDDSCGWLKNLTKRSNFKTIDQNFFCDYLIVGVQSDPTIDRKTSQDNYSKISGKQKNKPIQTLEERLIMIKAIKFVDEVFAIGMKSKLPNKKNISKKPKIQVKKIKTIKEKELTH